ncbi:hypothetical protein M758_10G017700 [Ceratodon purpureus]|nr:hypothetical protein M758_10G017700 [Ceratodon purpureus]
MVAPKRSKQDVPSSVQHSSICMNLLKDDVLCRLLLLNNKKLRYDFAAPCVNGVLPLFLFIQEQYRITNILVQTLELGAPCTLPLLATMINSNHTWKLHQQFKRGFKMATDTVHIS